MQVTYLKHKNQSFPVEDSPRQQLSPTFIATQHIISKARSRGEPVLVHCHAGVSRSASIVIAYLISACGWSLREAFEKVYVARPIIR